MLSFAHYKNSKSVVIFYICPKIGMDKVVGPVTIPLQGKSPIHEIPLGIFLDQIEEFSYLSITLHIKSTETHGRIICCQTKEEAAAVKRALTGRVTDVDKSLMISNPGCFVSPIVGSGGLESVEWFVSPAADVIDATVFVVREMDGEEKDDTVAITAIVHTKKDKKEVHQEKGEGEPKTKRRRRGW